MDVAESAKKKSRTPWRDNIEAMVGAIVMAVFLKYFIIEAYKIPTGSMQPTLMGETFADGNGIWDRILVDKLSYHLRDPERFEIVVFRYPLDRAKSFVKRLVGMPNEELRIQHGDLWVRSSPTDPWRIPRRSQPVMDEMWKLMQPPPSAPATQWRPIDSPQWVCEGTTIRAQGDGQAQFTGHGGGPIRDHYTHGYPAKLIQRIVVPPQVQSGANGVGDLRLKGTLRPEAGCREIAVELREGARRYRFSVPGPAADPQARIGLALEGGGLARSEQGPVYRLAAGRRVRFDAQNLDDRLRLTLDGTTQLELDIEPSSEQDGEVRVGTLGSGAEFGDLKVYRDVFYTPGSRGSSWTIPQGQYFMLGDNTQNSSDGREWSFVNLRFKDDLGTVQEVRGNYRPFGGGVRLLEANPVRHPSLDGPRTWIRDEWGEVWEFPSARELPLGPGQMLTPAPVVPRELIVGRAVFVFWPLKPFEGFYRWRWVH